MKWHDRSVSPKTLYAILFTIVTLLLGGYLIQEYKIQSLIDKCPRYTIAYTTTVIATGRSKEVNYRYSIMGQNFTGTWTPTPRSIKDYFKGGFAAENLRYKHFLIRVNCKQLGVSQADWDYSIPAQVTSAPYEGWRELPVEFQKTEFAD